MNAIQLLKNDHKKLKGLLADAAKTTTRAAKKREKLLKQIIAEVKVHTKLEEQIFYPAIEKKTKVRDMILEAYEEHALVDYILAGLQKISVTDEKWKAKLSVLSENLHHHFKEEERDLFPKCKTILSTEELNQLGEEMQELQVRLQSGTLSALFMF